MRLFKQDLPDLVVTDIVMPDREDMELIVEMKRTAPNVRVIAITGWAAAEVVLLELAGHPGADAGLMKPFSSRELVAQANRVIRA